MLGQLLAHPGIQRIARLGTVNANHCHALLVDLQVDRVVFQGIHATSDIISSGETRFRIS